MSSIFKQANENIHKYKQIVQSIEETISDKILKLLSLNKVKMELSVSLDTVLIALNELKEREIINSVLGKCYFIKSSEMNFENRYFVLFDELYSFNENFYNSLMNELGDKAEIEIYFHHFNRKKFKKLVNDS